MASRHTNSMPRVLALLLLGIIALMFWHSGCASTPGASPPPRSFGPTTTGAPFRRNLAAPGHAAIEQVQQTAFLRLVEEPAASDHALAVE